jgi:hypothetical protein
MKTQILKEEIRNEVMNRTKIELLRNRTRDRRNVWVLRL